MSKGTASAIGRRSLQLRRELALKRIAECMTAALEAENDVSRLPIFLSRFSKLETHCANFETHHLKLCSELTDPDDLDKEDEIRSNLDDQYFRIIGIHAALTSNVETTPSNESHCHDSSVKLPRLNLLHFDGDVKAWGTFFDMFNTMIHQNKRLSNIERFSILLSLLHGEPLQLLKGFPLSENNYLDAYGALVDRYQCKRKLAFHHWEELHQVKCKSTSPTELRHLVDTFKENIAVLKNLKLPVDSWDFPLFHLLINKLDVTTRERFELQNTTKDIPSFSSLLEFLDRASQALDLAEANTTTTSSNRMHNISQPQVSQSRHYRLVKPRTRALVVDNRTPLTIDNRAQADYTHRCIACQGTHLLMHCPSFKSLSPHARYDFVKKNKCCVNCLRTNHLVRSCPSSHRCIKCRTSHHTLLHFGDTSVSNTATPPAVAVTGGESQSAQGNSPASVSLFSDPSLLQSHTPLLATAVTDVLDAHGNHRKIRVVIDSGSQSNFMTKSCANRLGLSLRRVATSVEGIGRTSSAVSAMTSFRLLGLDSTLNIDVNAFVVSSICSSMPSSRISTQNWQVLKPLQLADPNFNVPGPIDVLVGVDVFCRLFIGDRIDCTPSGPSAFKTKLGWIVMGNVLGKPSMSFSSLMCNSALEFQLRKFWEIDELLQSQKMSDEDTLCENIFKNTHTRDASGRYIVRLPFKTPSPSFGTSFTLAHHRLLSLEKRLFRSPELRKEYNSFMQDYLDAGHMELIANPTVERAYYIPHHCVLKPDSTSTRLRVVFDGTARPSELGYAAAVYFRITHPDSSVTTHLIMSRSKVAPLKKISIPRLELSAAVLLSGLIEYVKHVFRDQIQFDQIYCWSDSMVTLAWIRSPSSRWQTFVGNRVGIIQERVPPDHWHHVSSEDNPADCASRGLRVHELLHHPLWWSGPTWLSHPELILNNLPTLEESVDVTLEQRQPPVSLFIVVAQLEAFLDKYSSLNKVIRIAAYVRRFVFNCRNSYDRKRDHLIASELHDAMLTLVKIAQSSSFSHEIDCLERGVLLPKPLRKLHPFIDEGGLIRVGGRLVNSELAYDIKHPLLLPRQHRLTELLIDQVHKDNCHPGLRTLNFLLAQNYWILSSRRAINTRLSKCIRCYRVNPKSITPAMGNLPKLRVSQIKPFSCIGVDFAGPFSLYIKRYRGARPFKAYICLFVCFATKAIHLEIVCSLSSDAFIGALRRFIARRGRCQRIHCDQGTNFVGAARSLSSLMQEAASTEAIEFSFNPPAAPHFGGLWEINVRAFKTHLARSVGDQILTHEEFSTLTAQIEALLNSRPLCEMGSDPNDMSVLTPGHFLTLEPLTSLPERQNLGNINCLDRWQLVQKIHRDFWKRWHVEYLHTLNQRAKWHIDSKEPKIGSLVLIKDDQVKPLHWSLARIVSLHPGRDRKSRVATVKTQNGQFQRPLVKLCPLPLD